MKSAFIQVVLKLATNLLAYAIKYVCRDGDQNGVPDIIDQLKSFTKLRSQRSSPGEEINNTTKSKAVEVKNDSESNSSSSRA